MDRYHKKRIGSRALQPESMMVGSTFVFESAEAGKSFFELAYGLREPAPGEATPGLIYLSNSSSWL